MVSCCPLSVGLWDDDALGMGGTVGRSCWEEGKMVDDDELMMRK